MLLDPRLNANALTWAADAHKARTSTNVSVGKGSSLVRAVELRGFEPHTSARAVAIVIVRLATQYAPH